MTVNVLDLSTANDLPKTSQVENAGGPWRRWTHYLLQPIDGASLAVFRMCFGVLVITDLLHQTHLIPELSNTQFHFSFLPGIHTFPGIGSVIEFGLLAFLAGNIALGLFYRVSTVAFLIAYTHFFLIDKAYYQPQFYAILLLALLLSVAPANRVWSLDNSDRKVSQYVPRWTALIFQWQFAVIYFYSGVDKLHSDWMHGYPQNLWIEHYANAPVIGPIVSQPWAESLITYGGVASDFLLATLLFWGPTFWLGVGVAIVTYLVNCEVFACGILPWLMVASIGIYGRPGWPRDLLKRLRLPMSAKTAPAAISSQIDATGVPTSSDGVSNTSARSLILLAALSLYVLVQVLVPLRQFLYPGNPAWAELGTRFSWYTVSNHKKIDRLQLISTDPKTGTTKVLDPVKYLSVWQFRSAIGRPDLIRELAQHIADDEQHRTGCRPIVRAQGQVALNQRPFQNLIDPSFNLAAPEHVPSEQWIVPLHENLPSRR